MKKKPARTDGLAKVSELDHPHLSALATKIHPHVAERAAMAKHAYRTNAELDAEIVRREWEIESSPPVDGAAVLDAVHALLGRFVVYPSSHAQVAHTLWIAHTHLMDAWESTPRLALLSPEPASGKTRALEVTELLVPNPVEAINVTPAYIFRKVGDQENGPPTLLHDEIDTVFGPKAKENEEIRGLYKAGHRRGAVAGRCVVRGKTVETEEIPAFCALALAGLGWLPDTILSRSIIIRMRRRAPGETVTPFRRRVHAPAGHELRDQLTIWAAQVAVTMSAARPEMPRGIEDRAADMWEPLLAIADAAGGNWPKRARKAATELVGAAKEAEPSLGVRLLADLKTVFDKRGEDKFATSVILTDLVALPESPWGDLKGKPITDRALATRLRQYGIKSRDVFIAGKGLKGYYREDLHDAWLRYLSPSLPQKRDERDEGDDPSEMAGFHTTSIALLTDSMRDENTSMQSSNLADIALIADVQGGGEEKANNTSPDDPGPIPDCLRRHPGRRCDHCGSELGIMNAWDYLGRPDGIWLHSRCEEAWHDSFKRGTR